MSKLSLIVAIVVSALVMGALLVHPAFGQAVATKSVVSAPAPAVVFVSRSNTSDNATNSSETFSLFTVPAGRRLVIETLSARVTTTASGIVTGNVSTKIGGQFASSNLVFSPQGSEGGQGRFACTHSVRLYAEPGSNVVFTITRSDKTGQGNKNVSFTGFLEAAN